MIKNGNGSLHITDKWGSKRLAALWLADRIRTDGARFLAVVVKDGRAVGETLDALVDAFDSLAWVEADRRNMRITVGDGAMIQLFTSVVPDKLRGIQHDAVWCHRPDEWPSLRAWELAQLTLSRRAGAMLITE